LMSRPEIFKRYEKNPIISSKRNAIFNAGAVYNGKVHLLPRVAKGRPGEKNYVSSIMYASSYDGKNVKLHKPFLEPNGEEIGKDGFEDARISERNGKYYITCTGVCYNDCDAYYRPVLAITKDFSSIEWYGWVGPEIKNKNMVIFPENEKIRALLRIEPNIQIIEFEDEEQLMKNKINWDRYLNNLDSYIVLERENEWESEKIGVGPPPMKTEKGWLLIYHGVDRNRVYRAGVALLDLENPKKVIARSKYPVLEPSEEYEKNGDVPNTVYPTGAFIKKEKINGKEDHVIYLYYGAADRYCCLATCRLNDMIDFLTNP